MSNAFDLPLQEWAEFHVANYRAGIFCDGVMWDGFVSRLSADNAREIMDGLSPVAKSTLMERWKAQPWSIYPSRENPAVQQILVDWCRAEAAK